MAKLPPPIIEGTIPAFYKDKNGTVKITVPFIMNRAVSPAQVGGFALKIKIAQSTTYLFDIQTSEKDIVPGYDLNQLNKVSFILPEEKAKDLLIGQYYKIQLAYLDSAKKDKDGKYLDTPQEIGYYSTAGVIKYTTKPTVRIENLEPAKINKHLYHYTGTYIQEKDKDLTERVYSYCFNIYDNKDILTYTTGELIHNSSQDNEINSSQDIFIFSQDLQVDNFCYIEYKVTTINGLQASSPKYKIIQKLSIDPDIKAIINAQSNSEEGYIDVILKPAPGASKEDLIVSGSFVLSRSCSDTNFSVWDEISKFELYSQYPLKNLWKDFTVEQGKEYQYSIQQYNDKNLYSNRIKSNKIKIDFEHIFLTDSKKQLKIKFNPKVNTIKTNVPETKVDTIGNKFPFIFRNSQVYYREFSISGLISYFMDEEGLFYSDIETTKQFRTETPSLEKNLDINKTINLIGQNIQYERDFKLKVLEWLTNGEPKIFRSPTEGNYIVRLTNCSLAPLDQLGRMLHTFTCTAYEIAEFNYANLEKYGFIDMSEVKKPILQMKTIDFSKLENDFSGSLVKEFARYIKIEGVKPGTQFLFTFENGVKEIITVGATGAYQLNIETAAIGIEFFGEKSKTGTLTYGYYLIKDSSFKTIQNAYVEDVLARQFIGKYNLFEELEKIKIDGELKDNLKVKVLQIYSIKANQREVMSIKDKNSIKYPNEYSIYKLEDNTYWEYKNNSWIEIKTLEEPMLWIEDEKKEVSFSVPTSIKDLNDRKNIKTSNSVIMEVSYQIQHIDYIIEFDKINYEDLYNAREDYENKKDIYESKKLLSYPKDKQNENQTFVEWYDWKNGEIKKVKDNMDASYLKYIKIFIEEGGGVTRHV